MRDEAHLKFGNLPSDRLGVSHLRRGCELLRVVFEERLRARARPTVNGAVARARSLRPRRQTSDEVNRVG